MVVGRHLKYLNFPKLDRRHTPDLQPAYANYVKFIENIYAPQNCKVDHYGGVGYTTNAEVI